jgi:hypothetical protein
VNCLLTEVTGLRVMVLLCQQLVATSRLDESHEWLNHSSLWR